MDLRRHVQPPAGLHHKLHDSPGRCCTSPVAPVVVNSGAGVVYVVEGDVPIGKLFDKGYDLGLYSPRLILIVKLSSVVWTISVVADIPKASWPSLSLGTASLRLFASFVAGQEVRDIFSTSGPWSPKYLSLPPATTSQEDGFPFPRRPVHFLHSLPIRDPFHSAVIPC